MARQFRSDDTDPWIDGFGTAVEGTVAISSNSTYDGANASCSGTSGQTALTLGAASTFENGDLVIIHQTRGSEANQTTNPNWELNKIASGGGSTSITLAYPLQLTYVDSGASQAQMVEIKQYQDLTVNSGITWSVPAWGGDTGGILAVMAKGTITITGTIQGGGHDGALNATTGGAGRGYRGGSSTNVSQSQYGEGTSRANATSSSGAVADNGGGGSHGGSESVANDGAGGGGGHGTAGTTGIANGGVYDGTGGTVEGNASLITMVFGGGGGGGSNRTGSTLKSSGGGGGAIVFLIGNTITGTGSILLNGGASPTSDGGGGGGAGGAGLFKGVNITLTNLTITATGGAGGSGENVGGVGRFHADYSGSISGTTNPTIDPREDLTIIDVIRGGGPANYAFLM